MIKNGESAVRRVILVPGLGGSLEKYNIAIKELNGVGNFVIVMIIFCSMILMSATIAYPQLKFKF